MAVRLEFDEAWLRDYEKRTGLKAVPQDGRKRAEEARRGGRTPGGTPSESEEQQMLFRWAGTMEYRYPELQLLHHVPNEGKRSKASGGRLRSEGLKRGVPDLFLPVARGGYHGLFMELKRRKGGKVSDDQKRWIAALQEQGYRAIVCYGWEEAAREMKRYLD